MKQNLTNYFDKAKNLKLNNTIIPNDEIRIVLGKVEKINLPQMVKINNNDFIHFLRKYKMTLISSGILALSMALFFNSNNIEKPNEQKKTPQIAYINEVEMTVQSLQNETNNEKKININNDNDSIITLPILKLTDEELAKIGITRVGSGYSKITQQRISCYNQKSRERLINAGYDTTNKNGFERWIDEIGPKGFMKSEIINYNGWDITKVNKTYPIMSCISYIIPNVDSLNLITGTGMLPMTYVESNYFDYDMEESIEFPITKLYEKNHININKNLHLYASQLIYLVVNLDSANIISKGLFVFVPTKELVSLLPKRYSDEIHKLYNITDSIKNNEKFNEIIIKRNENKKMLVNNSEAIVTKMIELSPNELEKIEIKYLENSIQVIHETEVDLTKSNDLIKNKLKSKGINTKLEKVYIKTPTIISHSRTDGKEDIIGWSDKNERVLPVAVNSFTYEYKNKSYNKINMTFNSNSSSPLLTENETYFMNELSKVNSIIDLEDLRKYSLIDKITYEEVTFVNKLLPVRIIIGDSTKKVDGNKYSEVIVWFVPTPEFLGSLPDRYRTQIENELNMIAKVEKGLLGSDELCKEKPTGFFNICNKDNNIKNINFYPNPILNEFNLEFNLENKAKVNIILKDISGKVIKNLITDLYLEDKVFSQKLNLEGILAGMYLLEIKSSDGSIVIQKILKN